MLRRRSCWRACVLASCLAMAWPTIVRAQQDPEVIKGVQFLRTKARNLQTGESALVALAMIKAEVPVSDPALAACLAKIRARFSGSQYEPERKGGTEIYEAALVAMVLANLDAITNRPGIESVANYLIGRQNPNGSWDYNNRTQGDCSISQYALLGLWECENAGVDVPPGVWDRGAGFYLSVQKSEGSWNYHRDEAATYPETLSMTAAGVGSLLLCERQLKRHRHVTSSANPLLTPIAVEGQQQSKYDVVHSAAAIDQAVKNGAAWIGKMFELKESGNVGQTPYYFLYGVERIGALADKESIGGVKWFEQGRRYIQTSQKPDGSWVSAYGPEVNTPYAILFLVKATKRSIQKIEIRARLGAGTLLGGRGLPKDLSSVTVAQGRMVVRPMNGAVEGMLKVLEDPRAENADSALAGMVERYQAGGSAVLRPYKDRFRKLLADPDPGVRRVAAWGLGRTGDLDVVPALVAALKHPLEDDSVVVEARTALQFLSRKIDGFGPAVPATPAQREEAAQKWLAWYNGIRPIDQTSQDDTVFLAPEPAAAVPPQAPAANGRNEQQ
jgi:hypothetical protein